MKVKIEKYGVIHAIAQCGNCNWEDAINTEEEDRLTKLRNRVKKHVEKTGHTVTIETGTSTDYYLEKEK